MRTLISLALLAALASSAGAGQLEDGVGALDRGDYVTARRLFESLARQGSAEAQDHLGEMYKEGKGVSKDLRQAAFWYRKAAELGLIDAQVQMARMHELGEGVAKDDRQAASWLQKAAEQGDLLSQMRLGDFYYEGWGVAKDFREAAFWYRKAADQNLSGRLGVNIQNIVQFKLGYLYQEGQGVPKDFQKAVFWYRKAAEKGNITAQVNLGIMYQWGRGAPQDFQKALFWYRKAAEKGDSDAEWRLGTIYEKGVPKDIHEAVSWYRKAAEQGNPDGQVILGMMYQLGDGVPQDFVQAHKWFNLAAARDDADARGYRDTVAALMTRGQLAKAQRLAEEWEAQQVGGAHRNSEEHSAPTLPPPVPEGARPETAVSGTGFFVSSEGHVLTNAHVVRDCARVRVEIDSPGNVAPAVVAAQSEQADLALLKADTTPKSTARFRFGSLPKLGEAVIVFGFPLPGVLASGGNLTTGQISALAGLGDDTRFYQISAPVQPGNSGGALVDSKGNVVGVVVGKLDAIKAAVATGDIPQNVNFAIKGSVAVNFLEAHGVQLKGSSSVAEVPVSELATKAQAFTVRVECLK